MGEKFTLFLKSVFLCSMYQLLISNAFSALPLLISSILIIACLSDAPCLYISAFSPFVSQFPPQDQGLKRRRRALRSCGDTAYGSTLLSSTYCIKQIFLMHREKDA